MTGEPLLRLQVVDRGDAYGFRLDTADTPAYSFRVLADLVQRLARMVVDVPRAYPAFTSVWAFEYRQFPGTRADLDAGTSIECRFAAALPTRCSEALSVFAARLLREPDADDPCFRGVSYTMAHDTDTDELALRRSSE